MLDDDYIQLNTINMCRIQWSVTILVIVLFFSGTILRKLNRDELITLPKVEPAIKIKTLKKKY